MESVTTAAAAHWMWSSSYWACGRESRGVVETVVVDIDGGGGGDGDGGIAAAAHSSFWVEVVEVVVDWRWLAGVVGAGCAVASAAISGLEKDSVLDGEVVLRCPRMWMGEKDGELGENTKVLGGCVVVVGYGVGG